MPQHTLEGPRKLSGGSDGAARAGIRPLLPRVIPPFPLEVPEEERASLEEINIAVNKKTGHVL